MLFVLSYLLGVLLIILVVIFASMLVICEHKHIIEIMLWVIIICSFCFMGCLVKLWFNEQHKENIIYEFQINDVEQKDIENNSYNNFTEVI